MKRKILGLALCLLLFLGGFPQLRPLRIGDTLPDLTIDSVKNHPGGRLRLSDYRGQWLILDFWFGACPSCIELFPKLEKMQKDFEGKVGFLLVNFESTPKIEATFRRWKKRSSSYRWPRLPGAVSDTVLQALFPHQYYPHEVWIDPKGVVRAFTSAAELTSANLKSAVDGKLPRMEQKHDMVDYDDRARPLFSQLYPLYPARLRYYSVVMGYVDGISGGWTRQVIDSSEKTIRVTRRNMSVLQLFSDALQAGADPVNAARFDFGKRVILDVKDSSPYLFRPAEGLSKEQWQKKNCFNYEILLPLEEKEKLKGKIYNDLEAYFGASCRIEKRMLPAWTLVRTADSSRLFRGFHQGAKDTTAMQLKNIITPWLLEKISDAHRHSPEIFADGTGYNGRFSISLEKAVLKDIPNLRLALQQYGLDLVKQHSEVEVLVFSEKRKDPAARAVQDP